MSVRIVATDALTTRAFRRAVLRADWPADTPVHGDDSADAVHLAAFDGDALVGACLLLPRPYPHRPDAPDAWQLRGMATAPHRQRQGIGSSVLAAATQTAQRKGGRLLWCESRTSASAFYARHGFVTDGPEYAHAETGAPHVRMWRSIASDEAEPERAPVAS